MPTGRFAPSPTSDLHVGNLRTALASWLLARSGGGGYLIRVEDLDQQRVAAAPAVEARQLADLAALGIDHDGDIVRQSDRLELYRDAILALGERVYPCFCTRREIAEASSAPHDGFRAYPGTCAHLNAAQRNQRELTRSPALRVRAEGVEWSARDLHAKTVSGTVDDFVLARSDGTPAYNLAVVVDDGLQGIDQVCRGDDLLSSAPRQAWLATQLGYRAPAYAHVSLVLNAEGKRLAKRDGSVTLADWADEGKHPADAVAWLCESLGLPAATSAAEALGRLPSDFAGRPQWWRPVTFA